MRSKSFKKTSIWLLWNQLHIWSNQLKKFSHLWRHNFIFHSAASFIVKRLFQSIHNRNITHSHQMINDSIIQTPRNLDLIRYLPQQAGNIFLFRSNSSWLKWHTSRLMLKISSRNWINFLNVIKFKLVTKCTTTSERKRSRPYTRWAVRCV